MDEKFVASMQKKLEVERERIKSEIEKVAKKVPNSGDEYEAAYPEYGSKEDENAAEVTEFEGRLSLERNLEDLLKSIEVALDKIKKGTYGICENCKEDIDKARLEANPSATLCFQCQQTQEKSVIRRIQRFFGRGK